MRILSNPETLIALVPSLLIALTFHEYAHARVAYAFGDMTAKNQGRMTLNPISHLDPIGTLMILFIGFGWARPVPINPSRFRDMRHGLLWVSLAGPLANLLLGFIGTLISLLLRGYGVTNVLLIMFMGVFIQLNVILAIFNLLPLPPLDGSKIVVSIIPDSATGIYRKIEPYAQIILIALVIFGGLGAILWPLTEWIMNLFEQVGFHIVRFLLF
ncbi:MAG: site-2 protease family protein [Dethiobacteria bacterium]